MGTRSYIGSLQADGSVRAVYCHWDGYPDGVGRTLREKYTDPSKIEALIDGGDLSSLGAEIGEKHSFDESPREWCTFYGRDRGDWGCKARALEGLDGFIKHATDEGAEYAYLHDRDTWLCWSLHSLPVPINMYSRNF